MTIITDNAIVKEGFSANYTIRERSRPPGYEENGKQPDEDKAWWEIRDDVPVIEALGDFYSQHLNNKLFQQNKINSIFLTPNN